MTAAIHLLAAAVSFALLVVFLLLLVHFVAGIVQAREDREEW